jgi:hypothetical protein
MPLIFYNTAPPANGPSNSITQTATGYGLRDFLLNRNIQNPIRYPQLSTSVNGSPRGGEPFLDTMVGSGVINPQQPLTVSGVFRYQNAILMNHYKDMDPAAPIFLNINNTPRNLPTGYPTSPAGTLNYQQEDHIQYGIAGISNFYQFRKNATILNLYLDATKQVDMADYISLQPVQTGQQQPSYDQAYGQLTGLGQVGSDIANVLGSVLNGQGVGISNNGVVPNFDIRASLAGRVLGAMGLLNDTKLGVIGGQQLALALANNAAFNTQQAILGKLNIQQNINAIFGAGEFEFPRPNYKITVPDGLLGKVIGTAERILGFTMPKSELDTSIFASENGNISNIEKANRMLDNTGKGQRKALLNQMGANMNGLGKGYDSAEQSPFRTGYAPQYEKGNGGRDIGNYEPSIYAYYRAGEKNGNGFVLDILNPNGYNGKNKQANIIPSISFDRTNQINSYGFTGFDDVYGVNSTNNIITPTFSWGGFSTATPKEPLVNQPYGYDNPEPIIRDKKTMIGKTQLLFNSKGMKNIVSRKGDSAIGEGSQIQTSVVNGAISKGSAVLQGSMFDDNGYVTNTKKEPEDMFCRAWTTYDRYDTVQKLIRNSQLNHSDNGVIFASGKWRLHNSELNSVLDDNGFVKIAPYKTDDLTRQANLPKKYMFSIENLAWAGAPAVNLLPIEQGPGDLLTGKFGRIMWFPPYDLTFSESSSVNLETTNFIGRGEPIYTYNNTERTGNLSFKVIIDHPTIMNSFAGTGGPSDEFIASWFAGCVDLPEKWGKLLTDEEKVRPIINKVPRVKKTPVPKKTPPDPIKLYFPNDITSIQTIIDWGYEINATHVNGKGDTVDGHGPYNGEQQVKSAGATPVDSPQYGKKWPDNTNYKLNADNNTLSINGKDYTNPMGWQDPTFIADLKLYLKLECPECKAICTGRASRQGTSYANQQLAQHRAESMQKWLLDNDIIDANKIKIEIKQAEGQGKYSDTKTSVDQQAVKEDRFAFVKFENEAKETFTEETYYEEEQQPVALNSQVKKRFYTETNFFEKLEKTDKFIFDKIRQKIRYFHPAFHSTTPEGFNSRLTFLLQCTRQGPTIPGTEPRNLAFGPQPVCILRIGDFYNTKIMIDNVSFDFEPLVWDLNPEGVGVQPMIANVTMSFKYIGGSSLTSPINKLQNALSFNYFANSQVYDPRADYVAKVSDLDAANQKKLKDAGIEAKRSTFPYKTQADADKAGLQPEDNYVLVTGLDPITQSLGSWNSDETTTSTTPVEDQTKTNDNTGNGPTAKPGACYDLKLSQVDYYSATTEFQFIVTAPDVSQVRFNSDYLMSVSLTNEDTNPNDVFWAKKFYKDISGAGTWSPTTVDVIPVSSAPMTAYTFKIESSAFTPTFTGLTGTTSYSFELHLDGTVGVACAMEKKISTVASTAATPTNTTNGDLKITGISWLEVTDKFVDDNVYPYATQITLGVTNENIFKFENSTVTQLATDEQVKEFVDKGLKVIIESMDGSSAAGKRFEQIVYQEPTYDPNLKTDTNPSSATYGLQYSECLTNCDNRTQNISALCSSSFHPGDLVTAQFGIPRITRLLDGNYMISVYHAGQRVASKNFTKGNVNNTVTTASVSGSYDSPVTGSRNNACDAFHAFQESGSMNSAVKEKLKAMYDAGGTPKASGIKVDIDWPTRKITWKVTIEDSDDGDAWLGFTSRGAGCNTTDLQSRFDAQQNEAAIQNQILTKGLSPADAAKIKSTDIILESLGDKIAEQPSGTGCPVGNYQGDGGKDPNPCYTFRQRFYAVKFPKGIIPLP